MNIRKCSEKTAEITGHFDVNTHDFSVNQDVETLSAYLWRIINKHKHSVAVGFSEVSPEHIEQLVTDFKAEGINLVENSYLLLEVNNQDQLLSVLSEWALAGGGAGLFRIYSGNKVDINQFNSKLEYYLDPDHFTDFAVVCADDSDGDLNRYTIYSK